jgi:hypothetical protein
MRKSEFGRTEQGVLRIMFDLEWRTVRQLSSKNVGFEMAMKRLYDRKFLERQGSPLTGYEYRLSDTGIDAAILVIGG